ncbi:MAG: RNA polymerase sigma factor [Gemmatimonadaceae bacterium]
MDATISMRGEDWPGRPGVLRSCAEIASDNGLPPRALIPLQLVIEVEPVREAADPASPNSSSPEKAASYRRLSDSELIDGLRASDVWAFNEYIQRFQRGLWAQAKRAGIPAGDRHDWVSDLLSDVAMTLIRKKHPLRGSLVAYLAGACRLKLLHRYREEIERNQRLEEAMSNMASGQRVVMESASEYVMHASLGPEAIDASMSLVLHRLASALDEGLTETERLLLVWVSNHIPRRQIAEWLGIEYMAAAQRISRLCRRLREAAAKFGTDLDETERAELKRFLRRAERVSRESPSPSVKPPPQSEAS